MAIARVGPLFTVIRGRIGSQVAKVCDGKQIISQLPLSVGDPNTAKQQFFRNNLATYSQQWNGTLTPAQRNQWEQYALNWQANWNTPNGFRTLWDVSQDKRTGKDAYVLTNLFLQYTFAADVDTPPLVIAPPTNIKTLVGAYDDVTNILTLDWTQPDLFEAGAVVLFKIQSQQKMFHKQLARGPIVTVETNEIIQATGALGAVVLFADIEDTWVYVQPVVINPSGGMSAPGQTILVQLET